MDPTVILFIAAGVIGFAPETRSELASKADRVVPRVAGSGTIEKRIRLTSVSALSLKKSNL